ncbi:MAG: hypothetical protein ACTSR8_08050 [Promethearchaeota archaeon]
MVLDFGHVLEYGVEIGYGIIYLILAISTIRKYQQTKNKLALSFFAGFICLAISGLYGGAAGFLNNLGFESIPVLGNKILEIYEGLALIALIFFIIGLIKV